MNWYAFIAGMCMMSIYYNIRDEDNRIFNIIIFIIIMVISTVQVIIV